MPPPQLPPEMWHLIGTKLRPNNTLETTRLPITPAEAAWSLANRAARDQISRRHPDYALKLNAFADVVAARSTLLPRLWPKAAGFTDYAV